MPVRQRQNIFKQNPMRLKVYRNTIEIILCCPSTGRHEDYPKSFLIYPLGFQWRKLTFPFKSDVIADSFLVRDGSSCLFSPLDTHAPSRLYLGGCCPCCSGLCESIHASVLLCLEENIFGVTYPLCFLQVFFPLFCKLPEYWREGFGEDIPTECSIISHSLYICPL